MNAPAAKVLIVEDELLVRLDISMSLSEVGFQTLEASRAEDAWQVLRLNPTIDALVTDIDLAGTKSGLQLAAQVNAEFPGLPIIIMSGAHAPTDDDRPLRSTFLAKPLAPGQLEQELRIVLGYA